MTAMRLLLGVFFGSLGQAYCGFGRREERPLAFSVGLLLMAVPTVVSTPFLASVVSLLIAARPFLFR